MNPKARLPQNLFPNLSECINLSVPVTECELSDKDHDLSIRTLIKYYKILTEQGYRKTNATNCWQRLATGLYRNNGIIGHGPPFTDDCASQHEQRRLALHRMAKSIGGLETIKWSQEFFSDQHPQTKNPNLRSQFRALHDGLSRGDGKGNNLLRSLRESLSPPPGVPMSSGDRMIYIDEIIPVHELNYTHSANRPCRPIKRYGTEKRPLIGGVPASQWVFIDLHTLAIMSCNYTDVKQLHGPPRSHPLKFWEIFHLNASFAGLPAIRKTKTTPQKALITPAGFKYDPIWSVLDGFWNLGCAWSYDIVLSLKHPRRTRRGAYIRAQLFRHK